MAASKRGGLGVDAFFKAPPKPTNEQKPKPSTPARSPRKQAPKAKRGAAAPKPSAPRERAEQVEKLTVHIPTRQIEGLEDLKRARRRAGARKHDATITALVIEGIDLLLKKRGK